MSGSPALAALLFRSPAGAALERLELGADAAALRELRERSAPSAVVLDDGDLERCRGLGPALVDCGTKARSQGLAARMLGRYPEIPMVAADYGVAGRVEQGVTALLRAAARRGEANLYVVGVPGPVFRELHARVADDGGRRAAAGGWHGELLDLLPPRPVPAELVSTFVGGSPAAQLVRRLIVIGAGHDHPVLVLGDTGTGKEVVARSIHDQGPRRHQRFVAVNCGAIPRELLESELFGALPGAYTGAPRGRRKRGLWEAAHLGTIFLDEVGDLPPEQQVKVLRTIDHGAIRPVGGDSEHKVDARVVAATNRDLLAMVREGRFREDLYYRLRGFLIRTPSLRDHPEDIPLLAQHFWRRITQGRGGMLPAGILDELRGYRWPGNARELKSVLANLHVFFGDVAVLTRRHLSAVFELQGQQVRGSAELSSWGRAARERIDQARRRRRIGDVLHALDGLMSELRKAGSAPDADAVAAAAVLLAPVAGELELLSGDGRGRRAEDQRLAAALTALRDVVRRVTGALEEDPAAALGRWADDGRPALAELRRALGRASA